MKKTKRKKPEPEYSTKIIKQAENGTYYDAEIKVVTETRTITTIVRVYSLSKLLRGI